MDPRADGARGYVAVAEPAGHDHGGNRRAAEPQEAEPGVERAALGPAGALLRDGHRIAESRQQPAALAAAGGGGRGLRDDDGVLHAVLPVDAVARAAPRLHGPQDVPRGGADLHEARAHRRRGQPHRAAAQVGRKPPRAALALGPQQPAPRGAQGHPAPRAPPQAAPRLQPPRQPTRDRLEPALPRGPQPHRERAVLARLARLQDHHAHRPPCRAQPPRERLSRHWPPRERPGAAPRSPPSPAPPSPAPLAPRAQRLSRGRCPAARRRSRVGVR